MPGPPAARAMIDHLGIRCAQYDTTKAFYQAALAPLGYSLVMDYGPLAVGFGRPLPADMQAHTACLAPLWLTPVGAPESPQALVPVHFAITAASRAAVDAFYAAALAAGGTDNGPPGVRAAYHPNYYGAFVLDPEGNNLEAVCHQVVAPQE